MLLLGDIASSSAYSYAFLRRRRSVVCLSVVCHIRAPCIPRSTELPATWVQRATMTHCVGSWLPRKTKDSGIEPRPPSQNLHLPLYDSPGGSTELRCYYSPPTACRGSCRWSAVCWCCERRRSAARVWRVYSCHWRHVHAGELTPGPAENSCKSFACRTTITSPAIDVKKTFKNILKNVKKRRKKTFTNVE